MPIDSGVEIRDEAFERWLIFYENVITNPADAKVGETVSSHSTTFVGSIAVETEPADPPKVGEIVTMYDVDLIIQIFGELG